jgi:hypothetical protein
MVHCRTSSFRRALQRVIAGSGVFFTTEFVTRSLRRGRVFYGARVACGESLTGSVGVNWLVTTLSHDVAWVLRWQAGPRNQRERKSFKTWARWGFLGCSVALASVRRVIWPVWSGLWNRTAGTLIFQKIKFNYLNCKFQTLILRYIYGQIEQILYGWKDYNVNYFFVNFNLIFRSCKMTKMPF